MTHAHNFLVTPEALALGGSARLIAGETEIRIRTGIWNFEEAVIDLSEEPPALAAAVKETLRAIAAGTELPASLQRLDALNRAQLDQLLSDLVEGGYLIERRGAEDPQRILSNLIGRPVQVDGDALRHERPLIWLITDAESVERHAHFLAESLPVQLKTLPEPDLATLRTADLTTRIEGRQTLETIDELVTSLSRADLIVAVLQNPSFGFLRNLNRVAEAGALRMVVSVLDGPFVNVIGVHPPHTGCLECFEQRSLARQQDHVAYHRFNEATLGADDGTFSPIMGLATNLALVEAALWATGDATRTVGRVLSVYLPTFELQAQRLLRIPSCPACGQHSKERMREIGFSTRAALDRIVSGILQ
jgi:thiazole/oxazole-forming peptide maturase SagC family component